MFTFKKCGLSWQSYCRFKDASDYLTCSLYYGSYAN